MNGTDLIVGGEIVLDGTVLPDEWCAYMDGGGFSARMVREALAQFPGAVTVRVNSCGGNPFEGEAIRVALAAHPGLVTVVIGGQAASAASLMIMSAGRIEISEGSFIMIHDPSTVAFGTAPELRHEADVLDQLSATYARVYAGRCDQPVEVVRQMMKDTTWFGGEDAVTAGFADAVAGMAEAAPEVGALNAAQAMHNDMRHALRMCADTIIAAGLGPDVVPAGVSGHSQANMAATQEAVMPNNNPAVASANTPAAGATGSGTVAAPVQMSADDTQEIERRAQQAERARARGIREMAAPFMTSGQVSQAQVDALIDDGTALDVAGNRLLTAMAANEPPVVSAAGASARITRDETDTRREGMIAAMMRDYSGPGEQFRGMRVRGLAMELAGNGSGFNETARIQRGMRSTQMMGGAHGVSDFAYITTEVMGRSLMAEYERRGAGWNIVTGAPQGASDFRELHAVRFGGDFQLKTVKENGEYQEATLADQAEGLKVERRGRTINLTFEAVINDDMGAFNRIPREFAMAARIMESSMVWSLLRTNAVLKSDGKALFHADHKNLASSGGAIAQATVAAGRKAMWEQRAFASKDGDDFLQITPNLLIVPPALETVAMQFVASITAAKVADTNPLASTLTPHVSPNLGAVAGGSDSAWYLVSSDMPPVAVAYLDGHEAPTVQTIEGMNPDKITMQARHIFGAAASEYRGSYKNAGS